MVTPTIPTTYLSEEILTKYKLTTQPFAPARSPETYFNTESSQILLNVIEQHLHSENPVMLISGEQGIGKTSFIESLLLQLPEKFLFLPIHCTPYTSIGLLLLRMLGNTTSSLPTDSETHTIIKKSASYLFQQLRENRIPVLVIDDAHQLTGKTLSNLIKFMHAIRAQNLGQIKILVFGERKIEAMTETIDSQTLNHDNIPFARMRALSKSQTDQYLDFKFKTAGSSTPFTAKQLAQIQTHAGGIPLCIEQLAASLLTSRPFLRFWQHPTLKTSRFLLPKILMTALGLLATWMLYILLSTDTTTLPPPPIHTYRPNLVETPLTNTTSHSATPAIADTQPNISITSSSVQTSSDEKQGIPATTTATKSKTFSPSLHNVRWLLQQPRQNYTLQIMTSWNRKTISTYAELISSQYPGDWIYYQTNRNGRKWHVLLYGSFPDRESALIAVRTLPIEIRKNPPWIRSLNQIRATL